MVVGDRMKCRGRNRTCDIADAALSILLPRRADGVDRATDGFFFFVLSLHGGLLQKLTEANVLFCVGNLICAALNRLTTLGSRENRVRHLLLPVSILAYQKTDGLGDK